MTTASKETLDALMRGLEIEKETFDLYTRAEQKTFNAAAKKVFRWLAKSEEAHYQKLTELYNSLSSDGRWVFYGGSTICLDEEGKGVTFDTDDHEALKLAMAIERKGIALFEELAAKTSDPQGKEMLETLCNEERE
ncbi:MAG TPA: ferritin family protein, partial [Geobacterales bacterium]|nr:ferritin family protein [Geobacterales bacterium]